MEAKHVPDNIKENVRAVLLSKTDGTGILVSKFLSDYKSFVHDKLKLQEMGYSGLQAFLDAIPDVCRLEYSNKDMAYRIFGISKPNMFVSSFVQKAEGLGVYRDSPKRRQNNDKVDKFTPSSRINEEWEPNSRGYFSLCVPIQNKLTSKEEITEQFEQTGEVVDVNMQSRLAFVRYSNVEAAKKAVELWGELFGVRRATEKSDNPAKPTVAIPTNSGDNKDRWSTSSSNSNSINGKYVPRANSIREVIKTGKELSMNNETKRVNIGSENPGSKVSHENSVINDSAGWSSQLAVMSSQPAVMCSQNSWHETKCDKWCNSQNVLKQTSAKAPEQLLQVYVGNWPSNADESELKKLIMSFDHSGCRIITAKNSDTKKFGFVDFKYIHEANRMIEQLNGVCFQGRTLQVRYGNNNTKDTDGQTNSSHHIDRKYESIEDELDILTIHSKDVMKDILPRPAVISNGNSWQSHCKDSIHDQISPVQKLVAFGMQKTGSSSPNKMSTQQKIVSHSRPKPDEMPPLENIVCSRVSKLDNSLGEMPPLEKIVPQNMPKLENYLDEMPPLERLVSTKAGNHWEKCSSNPQIEQNYHRNGYVDVNDDEEVEKNGIQENEVQPIQLNIANFPYGTSEADLTFLLSPYGVKSIVMMNSSVTKRSTYAFALFNDITQAQNAMLALDQWSFHGRRLNVTFTTPLEQITSLSSSQLGGVGVQVADEPAHQFSPLPSGPILGQHGYDNLGQDNMSRLASDAIVLRKLTITYKDYLRIIIKLHGESEFHLPVGCTLKVLITHVENDKFFWGQVLASSVHGVSMNISRFQELSLALQYDECRTHAITGLGRCTAMFDDTWYRGWCTQIFAKDGEIYANVLYIDYGNTELMPLQQIFQTNIHAGLWVIPCMAKPFKLTKLKQDLKKMTNEVVMVEVAEMGTYNNNFVTTVSVQ